MIYSITPENPCPLHQRNMAASFTPLQPTLGIVHGDLRRLVCGCSAMETHFIKLPTNSSIFTCYEFQHSAFPFCELVWYTTSRLSRCCSYMFPLHNKQYIQLTGAALAGQTFDKLTCWKGGILCRCHTTSVMPMPRQ